MAKKKQNSDKGNFTLEENLALTNKELTSNWSKLASLIRTAENLKWEDARTKAVQLMKDKPKAFEYIDSIRSGKVSKTDAKPKAKESSSEINDEDYQTHDEVIDIPKEAKRGRFSQNYKRLLKLAPDLETRLLEGERVTGKSKVSGYQDFNLELIDRDKRGFYLAINHYKKMGGDLVPDPDMVIRFDPKVQIVEALTIQNQFGGYAMVYDDMYKPKLVNPREKKTQNAFLENWLLSLISYDHQMEWLHDEVQEESTEPNQESETTPQKADEKVDNSESVNAKIKDKKSITNLYKANYQALLRLFPDLNERLKDDLVNGRLVSTKKPKYGYKIEPATTINKTTSQFVLHDENNDGSLMIAVQKVRKQAWVTVNTNKVLPIHDYANDLESIEKSTTYKVNDLFSRWLQKTIKTTTNIYWFDGHGLTEKAEEAIKVEAEKALAELSELRDKYPIVIEWSEGGEDYPKGFNNLDELSKALLLNGFTSKPNDTYIKNKVWFRGYESSWRIDVSKSRGDFDPSKDDLLKYLESGDKNFDWSAFTDKPKGKESSKQLKLADFQLYRTGDLVARHKGKSTDNKIYRVKALEGFSDSSDDFKVIIEDSLGVVDETIEEQYLSLVMSAGDYDSTNDSWKNKIIELKDRSFSSSAKNNRKRNAKDYDLLFTNAGGVTVASDKSREENGDYKTIAHLTTPVTYFEKNIPQSVIDKIEAMHSSELIEKRKREVENSIDKFSTKKTTKKSDKKLSSEITDDFNIEFDLPKAKKDASTIPVFEVGKVELTEQHKRAGITKRHINWINKNKQGMVITPRRNPINNTESLEKDLHHKAKRPGKRISRTGQIYYEGRSNRSDLTKHGL